MPRINVEDSFWSDYRFFDFAAAVGCRFKAIGILVCAWKLAQEFWRSDAKKKKPGRLLIPADRWASSRFPESLFECGWAERRENGDVYLKGSEDAFKWLEEKAINGRKGGSSDGKQTEAIAKQTEAIASFRLANGRYRLANGSERKQTEASSTSSSSSSSSSSSDQIQNTDPNGSVARAPSVHDAPAPGRPPAKRTPRKRVKETQEGPQTGELVPTDTPKPGNAVYRVFEAYRDSMLAMWSTPVQSTGFVLRQCKNLIERVGLDAALQIAAYYPSRKTDWYVKKGHSPEFMVSDHSTLLREISTQVRLTPGVVKHITEQQTSEEQARLTGLGAYVDPFAIDEEEPAPVDGARFLREAPTQKLLEG
jgi:hypothetical protein